MCKQCAAGVKVFRPPNWSVSQLKQAIPAELFVKSTPKAFVYLLRDVVQCAALFYVAYAFETSDDRTIRAVHSSDSIAALCLRTIFWAAYWWLQGLTLTGLWVIAHECGHHAFSASIPLCDAIGFVLHTALGTPYYNWKYTHRHHHRYNSHMEKDEHWIPDVRDGTISEQEHHGNHEGGLSWTEVMEDTPVYQLLKLVIQQAFGFHAYLLFNISGQPSYKGWVNHYDPYSVLFQPNQRVAVLISDIGLATTLYTLYTLGSRLGVGPLFRLYGVPWFAMSHWIMMIVFLQHTDPVLPHYRGPKWTYTRGALATMDRDFLGWQGRYFLHNVSHCHVVHHFFPELPHYNLPAATEYAKELLGSDYRACETPVFQSLWLNQLHCQYVDSEGDVLFYKDRKGRSVNEKIEH